MYLRSFFVFFLLSCSLPNVIVFCQGGSPGGSPGKISSCNTSLRPGKEERILITGGTGMIGSQLVKQSLDTCVFGSSKRVFVLARWRSNLKNLSGYVHRIKLIYGDVTDAFHTLEILRETKPDYILHFAAQAINGVSFQAASLSLHVNIQGTLNILEGIRVLQKDDVLSKDLRILVAGSSAEYGAAAIEWEGTPIPETAMLKPFTPYGVSKVAQENLAVMYASTYGIKATVARIFIQMAEGGTDQLSLQNFAKQIAEIESRAEREKQECTSATGDSGPAGRCSAEVVSSTSDAEIPVEDKKTDYVLLHGDLSTSRDVTDVADSARIFLEICKRGTPGEAYNVGSGVGYTIRDMLNILLRYTTVPIRLEYDPTRRRGADEKTLLADNRKVRELTGWVPSPNITDTAVNILNHWRDEVATRNR
ncbi:unnamed protein product [Amoebophrya sp. A25]|nr:unnamed protein product [Amoebophrya sp. A25]|eukprot:GSA25T00023535001.1